MTAFWKQGGNKVCSIRDCNRKATKQVNLAVVGQQRFGAFGKLLEWETAVERVEVVMCDECAKRHSHATYQSTEPNLIPNECALFLSQFVTSNADAIDAMAEDPHLRVPIDVLRTLVEARPTGALGPRGHKAKVAAEKLLRAYDELNPRGQA